MKAVNSSYQMEVGEIPQFEFTDHEWFIAFKISGDEALPSASFYIENFQDAINLKNSFLSSFNKLRKELGYDR